MKLIFTVLLPLLCKDVLSTAKNSQFDGQKYDDESLINPRNERTRLQRSADSDMAQDYGARCISCGKLGSSYSASASASAAASSSSGSDNSDGGDSYSIPAPNYSSTYNAYPMQRSYSQTRESSSYGRQNENLPVSSYPQSGSSSSYSRRSGYHMQPQYQASMPTGSGRQNSQSSYSYSRSGNSYSQPNSHSQGNVHTDSHFNKEMDRMWSAMNQGKLSPVQYPYSTNGDSHRSEWSSESRYVNGEPVYEMKSEKKYKDGKVVHDFLSEKGPEELGTSDALVANGQHNSYQSSQSFSRQHATNSDTSFSPTTHTNYFISPREYKPVSKETSYSETRSSSHQPIYPINEQILGNSYLENQNTHRSSVHSPELQYPIAAGTKIVESSYENKKVISQSPHHYAPISRPALQETTSNITSSSSHYRNTDSNHNINQALTPLNIDRASNLHNTNTNSDDLEKPLKSVPNPNAYQSSMTSYNKETKYSSGMQNRNDNVESKDSPVLSQPYEGRPSISSEPIQSYNSINEHSSRNTQQRSDVSPYHDSQQARDIADNDYVPRGLQEVESANSKDSNNYYQNYYTRNSDNIQTDNVNRYNAAGHTQTPNRHNAAGYTQTPNRYNAAGYTQTQNRFGSNPYRVVPTYARLPSRWLETKTSYKYKNGRLIGETRNNKIYEDGVLIHENTTESTREQMAKEGIDVFNLDLKLATVHQPSNFKSHEQVRYVQESSGTSQQPLVRSQNQVPYSSPRNWAGNNFQEIQSNFSSGNIRNQHNNMETGGNIFQRRQFTEPGLPMNHQSVAPRTSVQKHEVYEEEEFINGEKIYDLFHERKFKDHKLIHENKTELLPQDLGVNLANKSNTYFTRQTVEPSLLPLPISTNEMSSRNSFRTSCSSCSNRNLQNIRHFNHANGLKTVSLRSPQGSVLSSSDQGAQFGTSGKSFKENVDIEEHYENGRLVKGQEESKKWSDGRLIDSKSETYHQGPSRTSQLNIGKDNLNVLQHLPAHSRSSPRADECVVNPCQNGATCRLTASSSNVCLCKFGFNGKFCEKAYCPRRFCRYGGTCSITNDHHFCTCQEGFTGYRCKTRVHQIRMAASR